MGPKGLKQGYLGVFSANFFFFAGDGKMRNMGGEVGKKSPSTQEAQEQKLRIALFAEQLLLVSTSWNGVDFLG